MTHEEILAWWAIGLAVFAVVGHIPLSMIAHHYLPKVEDYFASRSREKLTERIAKLQHRLAQLNDPKYFEDVEWSLREQSFVILYLFGMGLVSEASSLFLSTGAVPRNSFWVPPVNLPLGRRVPEFAIAFFLGAVFLAGRNMFISAPLKPSKRPKLRSDIQTQIDALKGKLSNFGT